MFFAAFKIAAALLGYQIGYLFDMLTTLQIVHLFPVMRLYMPTGLFKFFKTFEVLNFQGLSIGLWKYSQVIDSSGLTQNGNAANYNFKKMGFTTTSFLMTSSDAVLCLVYISFFPVAIQTLRMVFFKSTMVKNLQRSFVMSFLPIVAYTM